MLTLWHTHVQPIHNKSRAHNNNKYKAFTINLKPKCCPWGTPRCPRSCLLLVVAVLQTTLNINMLGANNADDDDDNDGAAADAAAAAVAADSRRREQKQQQHH